MFYLRNFILLIILLFVGNYSCFSSPDSIEKSEPLEIVPIYVHGVAQYTEEHKDRFQKQAQAIHENLLELSKKNEIIKKNLLLDGALKFSEKAETYYWGSQYQESIKRLHEQFLAFDEYYDFVGGFARKMLALPLNDMLWLTKPYNLHRVLSGLVKEVKFQTEQGKKVMLLGHSAGSLVIYYTFLYHEPSIDIYEIVKNTPLSSELKDEEFWSKLEKNKYTCMQALFDSGIGKIDGKGELVGILKDLDQKNQTEWDEFKLQYYKEKFDILPDFTDASCFAEKDTVGYVSFGSPIASAAGSHTDDAIGKQTRRSLEQLYRTGKFWLHINHIKDFIGVPIKPALSINEYHLAYPDKEISSRPIGFMENNPKKARGANITNAHGWYLKHQKGFAKLIIKTYEQGFLHAIEGSEFEKLKAEL